MIHWREKVGVICLIGFALIACFRVVQSYKPTVWLQKVHKSGKISADSITRLEVQFQCVRNTLKPGQEIGFLSSVDARQRQEYYLLVQYILAPVLVADTPDYETIVAYFPDLAALHSAQAQVLEVSLDCGNGVLLLKNNNLR